MEFDSISLYTDEDQDFCDCPDRDDEELEEAYSDDDGQKPPRQVQSAVVSGHLQTPITRDEVDDLMNNDTFYCFRHKELKKLITERGAVSLVDSSADPIACIQSWVKSIPVKNSDNGGRS
ncbi:hypothetical protein M8J77_004651 [Diaphorina citri]|jgi:hypothetical protein|nr:hypothetical protein M8J77_004651 [Diaphorina citri]